MYLNPLLGMGEQFVAEVLQGDLLCRTELYKG